MSELNKVWEEAVACRISMDIDSLEIEEQLLEGVKIKRHKQTGIIRIFDTNVKYDKYKELDAEIFIKYGWRKGVYAVVMDRIRDRAKDIQKKIQAEANTRRNDRHVEALKKRRVKYMKQHLIISNKFKKQ